jgi:pimeloyl-ACP methyl ester carboxylesterase
MPAVAAGSAATSERFVDLTAGPIGYRDTGETDPAHPVLVMLGGLAMDGRLWDGVVAALGPGFRCVRPTLPFGSHTRPMKPDADLSLRGLGRIVSELLESLSLDDVTLCFNDWSAAPTMIADGLMDRVGRLVLTPCEAFENYPPGLAGKAALVSAKLPGGMSVMRFTLATRPLRRLPFIYGQMSKRGVPDEMMSSWLEPLRRAEIRRDLARYTGDVRRGRRDLLAATDSLGSFEKPVLIVWSRDGKMMPPAHGRRFADAFPNSRLVELSDCYTLMPIDQPEALARELAAFVAA